MQAAAAAALRVAVGSSAHAMHTGVSASFSPSRPLSFPDPYLRWPHHPSRTDMFRALLRRSRREQQATYAAKKGHIARSRTTCPSVAEEDKRRTWRAQIRGCIGSG